jgi:glutaredoxin-like YruB-family protein
MVVKIYSTNTCPYCVMAKEYFDEHKVVYQDFDVAGDMKAREEMIQKSKQMGVPVIDIDGKIIVGFDKAKIDKILDIK